MNYVRLFSISVLLGLSICQHVLAGQIQVNTTDVSIQDDGQCTLIEAVIAANQNTASGQQSGECAAGTVGTDQITISGLNWPVNIDLSMANLPIITEAVELFGPGVTELTLIGNGSMPIFITEVDFSLTGMTAIKGGDYGAGLRVTQAVDLSLNECAFSQHEPANGGGVIDFMGSDQLHRIIMSDCSFQDNNLVNGAGAVLHVNANNQGNVQVDVVIESSDFRDNVSSGHGGVIALSKNSTSIVNLSVIDSAFVNNTSGFRGGVLFQNYPGGEVIFKRNLLHMNQAGVAGGALYMGTGSMQLINNTFHLNQSGDDGGAIYARAFNSDEVILINNTITNNIANSNDNGATGGGLWSNNQVYLSRNIVADNAVLNAQSGVDCWGSAVSEGHNLIGDIDGCQLQSAATDLLGDSQTTGAIDPLLSALGDFGGPTQSRQPMTNSPAIDYVPINDCLGVDASALLIDQRHFVRPADGDNDAVSLCDVGAVERNALPDLIFANGFDLN